MRVGWLGLGAMGGPMARRAVAAGLEVRGFDVVADARDALVRAGGREAGSPADAARDADVLAIMVATPDQVEQVLWGDDGAADALPTGAIVIVFATVGDRAVTRWAERLAARGVQLIDAPVSGGVARAGQGDLLVMASGASDGLAVIAPLLDALASTASVVGVTPGDGQRMKLVNQLLCGVHIAAAAEALSFAESLGLDPRRVWDTVRHGAAASFMLDDRGERMLAPSDEVRSAIDIFVKDMGLVVDAAERAGHDPVLARTAGDRYRRASAAGLGRADDSRLIELYRGGDVGGAP